MATPSTCDRVPRLARLAGSWVKHEINERAIGECNLLKLVLFSVCLQNCRQPDSPKSLRFVIYTGESETATSGRGPRLRHSNATMVRLTILFGGLTASSAAMAQSSPSLGPT